MITKSRSPVEVLAVLLCAPAASARENRGPAEQRAACAPDSVRLCIPDATRVERCLRQNKSVLSDACRSEF
jgi:hypothetical protein